MNEENFDESEIEKIVPNYGNLSKDEQKRVLEQLYHKQFLNKEIEKTLADIIKKQQLNKEKEEK